MLFSHLPSISEQPRENQEIKFHKYLKYLKSLTLLNVGDRNFTETMFDMACAKKLKELSLSFANDLPLPNFSEALSRFIYLQSLSISTIPYNRINFQILHQFIAEGAYTLRTLILDSLSLTDD